MNKINQIIQCFIVLYLSVDLMNCIITIKCPDVLWRLDFLWKHTFKNWKKSFLSTLNMTWQPETALLKYEGHIKVIVTTSRYLYQRGSVYIISLHTIPLIHRNVSTQIYSIIVISYNLIYFIFQQLLLADEIFPRVLIVLWSSHVKKNHI